MQLMLAFIFACCGIGLLPSGLSKWKPLMLIGAAGLIPLLYFLNPDWM